MVQWLLLHVTVAAIVNPIVLEAINDTVAAVWYSNCCASDNQWYSCCCMLQWVL